MTWKDKGYTVAHNFTDVIELYEQCKVLSNSFNDKKIDVQCPLSQSFYNSPIMDKLLQDMTKNMERLTGIKLFKTYSYWRMYKEGETLLPHTDRPACEISVTLCIGGDPWDIFIKGYDGVETRLSQKPGDALIYRGCDLLHWREEFEGDKHAQVFLHYVDKNGPNKEHKDDKLND